MQKLLVLGGVVIFGISACGSQGDARQAASVDTPPPCSDALSTNCLVSTADTAGSIAVQNGARIVFEDAGRPASTVGVSEVCWADEDEVDPNTCVTELSELPTGFSLESSSTLTGGESWPTYAIAVDETFDNAGESFLPLPARITFIVGDSRARVVVEVACCDAPAAN